ncbi:hypothetical protein B296_00015916, partial [Ensete ventricosum]
MNLVVGPESSHGDGARKEEVHKVPFLKLFAFADTWDYVLMALGSIGACAHGASVPIFFIFFGKLINIIGVAFLFPTTVSHRVAKVRTTAPSCKRIRWISFIWASPYCSPRGPDAISEK